MSDRPLGPEWSQASDGDRHPPEPPATPADVPDRPLAQGAPTAAAVPDLPRRDPNGIGAPTDPRTQTTDPMVRPVAPVKLAPIVQPAAVIRPVAQPEPEARAVPAPGPRPVPEAQIVPVPPVTDGPEPTPIAEEVATVVMPPLGPVPPRAVPSLDEIPVGHPDPVGTSDQRADVGPMFPDLFQQAVAGSRLADTITVHFADGEHRESLDVPTSHGPIGDDQFLVSAASPGPSEVGAFTGASAKKRRWRL